MPDIARIDYIIVGQGLAGSAVALQLIRRGKKILVIDTPELNTSSRVAAGLFNPFTGKKMAKTWLADTIFPYLHIFYQEAEAFTGQKFFYSSVLYKPFLSVVEQNEWMGKSADPAFSGYIQKVFTGSTISGIKDEFGGLLLKQCGHLDTTRYMAGVRSSIVENGLILNEKFLENELQADAQGVTYKGYRAQKIIFCQGEYAFHGKWFGWLPLIPLKGETLTIQTDAPFEQITSRGVYVVPSGKNELRIGSTYNWDDNFRGITDSSRQELIEKLEDLIDIPYKIISQDWGMRPTTPDRRPLMGSHPDYKSIIIFNGLGTKGVSLSPYFSNNLIAWLEGETDLNKEADVNRYKSLYSKFTK